MMDCCWYLGTKVDVHCTVISMIVMGRNGTIIRKCAVNENDFKYYVSSKWNIDVSYSGCSRRGAGFGDGV